MYCLCKRIVLKFLGHMEIFVGVNLKRILKTRVAEIRSENIGSGEPCFKNYLPVYCSFGMHFEFLTL